MTEHIPGPRGLPLLGNIFDLKDPDGVPIQALERLVNVYGPIVKFRIGTHETIVVGGYELFEELCDEKRFWKLAHPQLADKDGILPGLFAAQTEKEMDWQQAHRILMPAFGPLAIENMFDGTLNIVRTLIRVELIMSLEMDDIACQLMLKWARQGPDHKILASEDFSRLTLDTIALCTMDYRFNSFYTEDMHPFVAAMDRDFDVKNSRNTIGGAFKSLIPGYKEANLRDRMLILQTGADIVKARRANPVDKKDLLNAMLHNKDPKTGETMRDDLIVANMRTFLIAGKPLMSIPTLVCRLTNSIGHETTSGLLTFVFANLLKHPSTYFKAQQEVDQVIGKEKVKVHHLSQLKYLSAVLKETLRLNPTAPGFFRGVRPENTEKNPTIGGGKYAMPTSAGVLCLLTAIQKDPKVWGNDADEFKPERMFDENLEKMPKHAWKPFGTGLRACIGRAFAWQEALLICALILQNYIVSLDDPAWEMKIQQKLTIKPKDLYMRAKLRPGITPSNLQALLSTGTREVEDEKRDELQNGTNGLASQNLKILYGSNTGTCEALARKLASQARRYGYTSEVAELDTATEQLPKDTPIAVITASYEGQPCDNATGFTAWLQAMNESRRLEGVKFAVFGVGHSDWRDTFQLQPKLLDEKLVVLGATRLTDRGQTDVRTNSVFADFEDWTEERFWPSLRQPGKEHNRAQSPDRIRATLKIAVKSEDRAAHLHQQNLQWTKVLGTKRLTPPGCPEKRHIEIALPSDVTYNVGDYLAVLPLNPESSVKRVMRRLDVNSESIITIADAGPTTLPVNVPMHVVDLLKGYVELTQPATLRDVEKLAEKASGAEEKKKLTDMAELAIYEASILQHRISILDLLEQYPTIELPFDQYLAMLPPLTTRHYSISSSSLAQPNSCTLTYSVIDAPTFSGIGERFHGVTGTYLQGLQKGDDVLVSVRATNKQFRLPRNQIETPIMMFCAGSGLAPFRGFIQERAYLIEEGKQQLAPALLFVGCRSKDEDALYADELSAWSKIGAVDVRYACSRKPEESEGCKYVQDRVLYDRVDVVGLFAKGAMVYTCGSKEVAQELGIAARELVQWKTAKDGAAVSPGMVEEFLGAMRNSRFAADVFS